MTTVNIDLVRITEADLQQMPATISDMRLFSQFDINKTNATFVAVVRFSKKIDYYKCCRLFNDAAIDDMVSGFHSLVNVHANRVSPVLGVPVVNDPLHILLAKQIREKAQEMAPNMSYQFYRVIIIFDQIYDKPQTCCCGLFGFNQYELFKMGECSRTLMTKTISNYCGCKENDHAVFIDYNTDDTINKHGMRFVPKTA